MTYKLLQGWIIILYNCILVTWLLWLSIGRTRRGFFWLIGKGGRLRSIITSPKVGNWRLKLGGSVIWYRNCHPRKRRGRRLISGIWMMGNILRKTRIDLSSSLNWIIIIELSLNYHQKHNIYLSLFNIYIDLWLIWTTINIATLHQLLVSSGSQDSTSVLR